MTPHLDSHSTTDPKPEILSAVLTGNRISRDCRNVRGIMHVHMCRKDDIFRQRRLNHSGVGGGIAFRRLYPAQAYSTVVVLVSIICMVLLKSTTIFCTGSLIFIAYLKTLFVRLGKKISTFPYIVILLSIITTAVCGLGYLRFR